MGQRYTFALRGAAGTRQVYEVTAVEPEAILYRVETLLDDDPVGEPLPDQRFPLSPRVSAAVDDAVGRETLTISGRAFDCRITEGDGQRVYTATGPDGVAFPGVVKVSAEDEALVELIRID
ncbi:hypothetical protein OAX78_01090 [Planctomycetota bacterium]|nr:hypothetical protein [Planctomycetota bacterium]